MAELEPYREMVEVEPRERVLTDDQGEPAEPPQQPNDNRGDSDPED